MQIQEQVADYLRDIRAGNTEEAKKLRFQSLATQLFSKSADARDVLAKISAGAERTILNIPRAGAPKTGYADIQYNNVIIEWERDISKPSLLAHAEDQLAEYWAGNWQSGARYDFTLIATDGRLWKVYAPDGELLLGNEAPKGNVIRKTQEFEVRPDNQEAFFYFLDRNLFRTQRTKASLDTIQLDFGHHSAAFINTTRRMAESIQSWEMPNEVAVAFEQWQKFLQLAYGKYSNDKTVFFIHTYLSAFAKLLAYAVLNPNKYPDDRELLGVLTGDAFSKLNVERFVEGDFFYWVTRPEYFKRLSSAFRELFNQIAEYEFHEVDEDILKGVYQELIDIDTRHALGEYYTPDWLCERIVDELPLERDSMVLDPACGSGSFLRAVVARWRRDFPKHSAARMTEHLVGIDIHPLSVQIAKTTLLLALGESVRQEKKPVVLRVYLANALYFGEQDAKLANFGSVFRVKVDDKTLFVNLDPFMGEPAAFDTAIEVAQHFLDEQLDQKVPETAFVKTLRNRLPEIAWPNDTPSQLYAVYLAMRDAKLAGRDSIWQFVLQNTYRPVFLRRVFDIVVGNPPWLTFRQIGSADYQQDLRELATRYHMTPVSKANMPHLELAALFLAHSGKYFCKDNGHIALVMPRSFLTADQHDNSRSGAGLGFKLQEVWGLDVQPLFNVPACVLFAQSVHEEGDAAERRRKLSANGIVGRVFTGRLPRAHLHWKQAQERLKELQTRWFYQKLAQGKKARSALVQKKIEGAETGNAYAAAFKQGATIVPRSFYFVVPQEPVADLQDRIVNVKTDPSVLRDAKAPWKNFTLEGRVHSRFLFRTAQAKNILPFVLVNPPLVVLPLEREIPARPANGEALAGESDVPQWVIRTHEQLALQGELETARWFGEASRLWDRHRTEANARAGMSLYARLDYQRGLTAQAGDASWLVIYTSSATDASAAAIEISVISPRFLAESVEYVAFFKAEDEARYVSTFLNSDFANHAIKEFQARGLFGERHVHKKILELPWPKFDNANPLHLSLAKLGEEAAAQARKIVGDDETLDLDKHALGQMRRKIRTELAPLMQRIDILVRAISTGKEAELAADYLKLLTQSVPGDHTARTRDELDAVITQERAAFSEREADQFKGRR